MLRAEGDQLGRLAPALTNIDGASRLVADFGRSLLAGGGASLPEFYPNARLPGTRTLAMMAVVTTIVLACPNTMQIFGLVGAEGMMARLRWRPNMLWGAMTVVLLVLALVGVTRPVDQYGFIYAQF